ncbi:MAG: hypothetical protein FWF25_02945, partial [Propionibacteriaceae bacterium]|nr:hypothetical protein [Propionibacteriaceae bacterium]
MKRGTSYFGGLVGFLLIPSMVFSSIAMGGMSTATAASSAASGTMLVPSSSLNTVRVPSSATVTTLVPATAAYNAKAGDGQTYGDNTWTDYRIEADVSNLTTTGTDLSPDKTQDWGNFQIKFRGNNQSFYALNIGLGGNTTFIMDSIDWTPLGTIPAIPQAPTTSTSVHYQVDVVGSVITLTVNGTQVWTWTDNYASAPRNV